MTAPIRIAVEQQLPVSVRNGFDYITDPGNWRECWPRRSPTESGASADEPRARLANTVLPARCVVGGQPVRAAGVVEADLVETSESGFAPVPPLRARQARIAAERPRWRRYISFTHSNALRREASARRRSTAGGKGGGSR
jgi:hypothetical protein